jgi:DNA-binding transcriptional LysR family regulator
MNYTLHQLVVFLKVTKTKSITKAAVDLHLTQPAVSIQLRNFQDQFEIPLTEIVGRKLFVTDFGNEIALAAERIIEEVNLIDFKTSAYKGMLSGRLRVSVVSTGKYVMPYFLSEFINANKGIELEMDVTNKSIVVESLIQNKVDFALVSILPKGLNLEHRVLMENKLFLVGNKDHTKNENQTVEQLFTETPLIFREDGSATRTIMENFLKTIGVEPNLKLQLTSNEAVKQAVIAGLGISIMPLIGLKNELENGTLHIIPIDGLPITTDWTLVWMKGKVLTPISKAYLEFIDKNKDDLFEKNFNWIKSTIHPNFH